MHNPFTSLRTGTCKIPVNLDFCFQYVRPIHIWSRDKNACDNNELYFVNVAIMLAIDLLLSCRFFFLI
jgi:hypothetical protein